MKRTLTDQDIRDYNEACEYLKKTLVEEFFKNWKTLAGVFVAVEGVAITLTLCGVIQ